MAIAQYKQHSVKLRAEIRFLQNHLVHIRDRIDVVLSSGGTDTLVFRDNERILGKKSKHDNLMKSRYENKKRKRVGSNEA